MATKSKGFIKMEWTCPNCNTRNPGPVKTCQSCGAPQPTDVKFEMGADQNFVKDEKEVEQAKKGADIHCGFCGTRNPADAKTCSQCGGDLKEGMKRQAGQLVDRSAAKAEPFVCPNCGFIESRLDRQLRPMRRAARVEDTASCRASQKIVAQRHHWHRCRSGRRSGPVLRGYCAIYAALEKRQCHRGRGPLAGRSQRGGDRSRAPQRRDRQRAIRCL